MAGATLDINVEKVDNITIVTLDGPVDSATHEHFKKTLDPIFSSPGAYVLLDCKKLTYINSRGLGLLVNYHRSSFANHGWFSVCNVDRKTVRTMDLLGLGKLLKFYDTRDEALADMKTA